MKADFEKLSYAFALAIIAACAELGKQKFFELGGQLIRSGTVGYAWPLMPHSAIDNAHQNTTKTAAQFRIPIAVKG